MASNAPYVLMYSEANFYWTASDFTETVTLQRNSPFKRTFIWELKKMLKFQKLIAMSVVHACDSKIYKLWVSPPIWQTQSANYNTSCHPGAIVGCELCLTGFSKSVFFFPISCIAKTRTQGFEHARQALYYPAVSSALILQLLPILDHSSPLFSPASSSSSRILPQHWTWIKQEHS